MKKVMKQEMERMYRAFYWESQKIVVLPVSCETKAKPVKEVN